MKKFVVLASLALLALAVFFLLTYQNNLKAPTGSVILEETQLEETPLEKTMTLSFYDEETNCSLNGEVFINSINLGKTNEGKITINLKDLENLKEENEIRIAGYTDSCFKGDERIYFSEYWNLYKSDVNKIETLNFISNVNPRWPTRIEEMQDFIRPEEVTYIIKEIDFKEDSLEENINQIFERTHMSWLSDYKRFGKAEYWQTPRDFLNTKGGDCEDWAIYLLSLIRQKNSSAKCYIALWETHASVLCTLEDKFIIMDQDRVKESLKLDKDLSTQEKKSLIRAWRNEYFESYGISQRNRNLSYLFNEKEYFEFSEDSEEFVDWILNRA